MLWVLALEPMHQTYYFGGTSLFKSDLETAPGTALGLGNFLSFLLGTDSYTSWDLTLSHQPMNQPPSTYTLNPHEARSPYDCPL